MRGLGKCFGRPEGARSPMRAGLAGVAAAWCLLTALPAAADQVYPNPVLPSGYRLDWCRDWAANCGQPAADAFCQSIGFSGAGSFERANDIGAATPTMVIATGQICAEPFCDGFSQIQCLGGNSPGKSFLHPMVDATHRLDWCLNWASGCGRPAADAFCVSHGFSAASTFEQEPDIGLTTPTRVLGSGEVCDQRFCDGFLTITCTQ